MTKTNHELKEEI